MSKILSSDINGKPLRIGDQVFIVGANDSWGINNSVAVIVGAPKQPIRTGEVRIETEKHGEGDILGKHVRKLDDHKPINESYQEMMNKLKRAEA